MMDSESSSTKPSPRAHKLLAYGLGIVSFIGFLDAAYLSVEHFLGAFPPCSILNGCERVLTSQYAVIANIPVALAGAVYYLVILALVIVYADTGSFFPLALAMRLTVLGLIASLALIYLQVFVIGALCLYCLVSAATSILLFLFSVMGERGIA